ARARRQSFSRITMAASKQRVKIQVRIFKGLQIGSAARNRLLSHRKEVLTSKMVNRNKIRKNFHLTKENRDEYRTRNTEGTMMNGASLITRTARRIIMAPTFSVSLSLIPYTLTRMKGGG